MVSLSDFKRFVLVGAVDSPIIADVFVVVCEHYDSIVDSRPVN